MIVIGMIESFSKITLEFQKESAIVYTQPFHGILLAIRACLDDTPYSLEFFKRVLISIYTSLKLCASLLEKFTSHESPEGLDMGGEDSSEQYISSHSFHSVKEIMNLIVQLSTMFMKHVHLFIYLVFALLVRK